MNSTALANFLYLRDPLGIEDEITISQDDLRTLAQGIVDEIRCSATHAYDDCAYCMEKA